MKRCIACGMPMETPSDFTMGDPAKDYCIHCARPDGSMQSFDEKKTSLAQFLMKTQGIDQTVANGMATQMMRRQPAWKSNFE